MISYQQFQLDNGLKVLVHEDESTSFVAFNILYSVGSKNENPKKTGYAHLMEHLMFSGSKTAPSYDEPVDNAGGESNAFTNVDVTNYYLVLPKQNLEVAFWLESDRMQNLKISQEDFDIQQKVVIEEFKETTINRPYGNVWHELSKLAYKDHSYQWPTIGKVPKHVENATLDEINSFYKQFYCPNNAVLVLSGNIDIITAKTLCKKWFADIPASELIKDKIPVEPRQLKPRRKILKCDVPLNAIYLAFQMGDRNHDDFYIADLISDVLGNGKSSRLYNSLVKENEIFININAYISGTIDKGLLVIEGKIQNDVETATAEKLLWHEIDLLKKEKLSSRELQKIKNSIESTLIFSEMSILNIAINLAYFAAIDRASLINDEADIYQDITAEQIYETANSILIADNCSTIEVESTNKN